MAPQSAAEVLHADPRLHLLLFGYACTKTRDKELAEELAQEAVACVLAGQGFYRWDRDRKSLLDHLSDVIESLLANRRRRAYVKREEPMAEDADDRSPDSKPSAEQQIDSREELERKLHLAERIRERVAKDPIIPAMLKYRKKGIEKPAELATRVGCSAKDIYRAVERLAHHRKAVLEEERKLEEQRMKGRAKP